MNKRKSLIKSAVSIKYNAKTDKAPKVTAKGKGMIGEKIVALAKEHGIPIKEDPDLVQILSQMDINEEIPPVMYHVLAELLAFIYRINQEFPAELTSK
jgi:flagellar biosynthesis protein